MVERLLNNCSSILRLVNDCKTTVERLLND